MKKILLLLIILSVCFVNCSRHKDVNGIEVSELLLFSSKKQHINYCNLLREAIKGNDNSIREITLLEFYDATAYDHSSVIVDLIEIIGEDKFIQSLHSMNKRQKQIAKGYIQVGLEYSNNKQLQLKTFKDAFPKIYMCLN
jgi:hypothetical protein